MEFCKVLNKSNKLMALLGASTSILFPYTVTVVPIPQFCSVIGLPVVYSSPLGLASFLHAFSLHRFPPFRFHLYCLLFVPFAFIYYFSISSPFSSSPLFFVFCYFI